MNSKRDNLCFSTLGCTDYSLDAVLALCKRFDIANVEIRGLDGELDNRKIAAFAPERIGETVEKLQKAHVFPAVLGTSCQFHDAARFDAAAEEGKASVEIAARLGARGIRVFGNRLPEPHGEVYARVIRGLETLCDFAADRGVDVLLETHGDYIDEKTLSPIADALGARENFGFVWDIEHTPCTFDGTYTDFYRFAGPLIRHVHIRDKNERGLTLPGEGTMPIRAVTDFLESVSYGGVFSLEWERKWRPELPAVELALEKFVRIWED